jgi:hypothetical protein
VPRLLSSGQCEVHVLPSMKANVERVVPEGAPIGEPAVPAPLVVTP